MTPGREQLLLLFGLLYGCGALVELLIRVSQGLPRPAPPILARNALCRAVLPPVVFFALPALLWPLVAAHRILGPLVAAVRGCCRGRGRREADGGRGLDDEDDDDGTTISGDSVASRAGRRKSGGTLDVLEKGCAGRGDAHTPRSGDPRVLSP